MLPNYEFRFEIRIIPVIDGTSKLTLRFIRRDRETDKFAAEVENSGDYKIETLSELPDEIAYIVSDTLKELNLRTTRGEESVIGATIRLEKDGTVRETRTGDSFGSTREELRGVLSNEYIFGLDDPTVESLVEKVFAGETITF